jgi:hypothetical protein
VFLNRNHLESLPPSLTRLSLDDLDVQDNKLCEVPQDVADWLDDHARPWEEQYADDERTTACDVVLTTP